MKRVTDYLVPGKLWQGWVDDILTKLGNDDGRSQFGHCRGYGVLCIANAKVGLVITAHEESDPHADITLEEFLPIINSLVRPEYRDGWERLGISSESEECKVTAFGRLTAAGKDAMRKALAEEDDKD